MKLKPNSHLSIPCFVCDSSVDIPVRDYNAGHQPLCSACAADLFLSRFSFKPLESDPEWPCAEVYVKPESMLNVFGPKRLSGEGYIGLVSYSPEKKRWAACWNGVPDRGDVYGHYRYFTKRAAVQHLVDQMRGEHHV